MNKEIDIQKYEGHTEGKWVLGEYKGRPSISAVEDVETPTWVRSIARGLNPNQLADHALLLDAPLILDAYKKKRNEAKWLREALQIITEDLDSAIAQGHIPIRATNGIDVTKIRNFAHDASS